MSDLPSETLPTPPPGDDPLLGRIISERYRILELIAQGGMGAVYVGEHVHMRKRVAIKILLPDAASVPQLTARFEREAIAGAHVSHPNVASATDFGQEPDGTHFLVLEYVRGRTLADEIHDNGPLDPERALRIARELAAALAAVHEMGIVHRDVKPGNVMLSESDDVTKLVDFGLAKLSVDRLSTIDANDPVVEANRGLTVTGTVFGTVSYMPPEIALGMSRLDARSDLYALGVTMYEMLTGVPPFTGASNAELFKAIVESPAPKMTERAPGVAVSAQLESVVMRLLEKTPEARFQTAEEVIQALEAPPAKALPSAGTNNAKLADGAALRTMVLNDDEIELISSSSQLALPTGGSASLQPSRFEKIEERLRPVLRGLNSAVRPIRTSLRPLTLAFSRGVARAFEAVSRHPLGQPVARRVTQLSRQLRRHPLLQGRTRLVLFAAPAFVALFATILWASTRTKDAEAIAFDLTPVASASTPSESESTLTEIDGVDADGWAARLKQAAAFKLYTPGSDAFLALAKLDPARFQEVKTRADALAVIVGIAFEENTQSDAVFSALTNDLGQEGLELLYDIVRSKGGTKAYKRALSVLKEPAVSHRASPALRIALDLRLAACGTKRGLFERAAQDGDERVLTELKVLKYAQCSRKQDPCCFKNDESLTAAIKALEGRLQQL